MQLTVGSFKSSDFKSLTFKFVLWAVLDMQLLVHAS